MEDGRHGQTGLTALEHVVMGLDRGTDPALPRPVHMAANPVLDKHLKCRNASSYTAQFTASGSSSLNGLPAAPRVMAASFLALASLCQRSLMGTTAAVMRWKFWSATPRPVQVLAQLPCQGV